MKNRQELDKSIENPSIVEAIMQMMEESSQETKATSPRMASLNKTVASRKLFLTCPTSYLERLIRKSFGADAFFLSLLGPVINTSDKQYMEQVADFIRQKGIEEVFIIQDLESPFVQSILKGQKGFQTYAEQHYRSLMKPYNVEQTSSVSQCIKKTAVLNLQYQADVLTQLLAELAPLTLQELSIRGFTFYRPLIELDEVAICTDKSIY